jgi:hypothetical protein
MPSKRNRSREAQGRGPVRRLAHELFSELSATYHEDDPSEYLLTKIEAVTLMLASDEALAPAYSADRVVGVSPCSPTGCSLPPPDGLYSISLRDKRWCKTCWPSSGCTSRTRRATTPLFSLRCVTWCPLRSFATWLRPSKTKSTGGSVRPASKGSWDADAMTAADTLRPDGRHAGSIRSTGRRRCGTAADTGLRRPFSSHLDTYLDTLAALISSHAASSVKSSGFSRVRRNSIPTSRGPKATSILPASALRGRGLRAGRAGRRVLPNRT